jgi:wingless-type MMTV integration site family protein 6
MKKILLKGNEVNTLFIQRRIYSCDISSISADTRETAFVNAITAAGIAYTIAKSCSMGELVECSCDKNLVRHNVLLNNQFSPNVDNEAQSMNSMNKKNRNVNSGNNNSNNNNHSVNKKKPKRNENKYLKNINRRKAISSETIAGMGENWEWSGCDDNVNFGNRKSKDFLDSRYRRRSDIKTLIKIHNNNAGRMAVKKSMRLDCKVSFKIF